MGKELFSPQAIAALVRAGDPRRFDLDFAKKRDTIIQGASNAAVAGGVKLTAYRSPVVRGRACVSYKDYHAHLLLRGITKYLRRRLRIVLPNRDRIVRGVIETLLDGTPMHVIRRDIRSFFESIEIAPIRDRLVFDTGSSALIRKYVRDFFEAHCPPGVSVGIPRGTTLSPLLAEMALQSFDEAVRATPGVFRYFRFSDDIIVFSTGDSKAVTDALDAALPPTMRFNEDKRSDTYFPGKREASSAASVEFLGYEFSTTQTRDKSDSRIVRVAVSKRKINRIKSRIILSFKSHASVPNWELLVDRIRFLSSNYRITRGGVSSTKDSPYVFSGIYYNYSACGSYRVHNGQFSVSDYDCAELKSVDGFYHSLLKRATTGSFWSGKRRHKIASPILQQSFYSQANCQVVARPSEFRKELLARSLMSFRSTFRALLTETLPYEVPVIFSNEMLFASLSARRVPADVSALISKLRGKVHKFTIPYNYTIVKDGDRTTALSIVHPNYQMTMSNFYDQYRQSMLDACSRSICSLRRPVEQVGTFAGTELEKGRTLKTGIPHIDPAEGEIDAAHVSSYFAYGKYNLLGKFVDSAEYRTLEKRFSLMRTLDVSKCFFHIYTHSVTWAGKGKAFAKAHGDTYSFEGSFDRLMQGANYNETNGIVVGPEISRIFAEIILQDIDLKVMGSLGKYRYDQDYSIRRYVDDYFIFSSSESILDDVQNQLGEVLERYKLFINPHKTVTTKRPFVSALTLARSDIAALLNELHGSLDDLRGQQDLGIIKRKVREVRRRSLDIRLICERHQISFSNISGWLLAQLRVLIRRSISALQLGHSDEAIQGLGELCSALLDVVFYICALDVRVRSTYSLCQIVATLQELTDARVSGVKDRLLHVAQTELSAMIDAILARRKTAESIELYNLMIIGAHLLGADFVRTAACSQAVDTLLASDRISYFQFITVKFCLLRAQDENALKLRTLNERVVKQITDSRQDIGKDAEVYLLLSDYLSSPDVQSSAKAFVLSGLVGGQPSKHLASLVGNHLAFADWSGVRIQHVLARKELRPVYSWA